jgi:hypothetical protein
MSEHEESCAFCNPKKMDWTEDDFYGYQCFDCSQSTAFIVSTKHRGNLNKEEKIIVEKLARKYYPNMTITWISERRLSMSHFYDFLKPVKDGG